MSQTKHVGVSCSWQLTLRRVYDRLVVTAKIRHIGVDSYFNFIHLAELLIYTTVYNFATVYDWRSTILLLIIYLHSRLYRRTRDPFLAILYIFNFYQHSEIFWQRNCVNSSLNYTMHLLHLRNNIRIPVKNNTPQHVYKILQQWFVALPHLPGLGTG